MAITIPPQEVAKSTGPTRNALVTAVFGDESAVGFGSRTADVRRWPSTATTAPRAFLWNKWGSADRDTDADDGDGLDAVTRRTGEDQTGGDPAAWLDVGLEFSHAIATRAALGYSDSDTAAGPQHIYAKWGVASSTAQVGGASSWHPLATGSLLTKYVTNYLAPTVAHLKTLGDVSTVSLESVVLCLGAADALGTGTADGEAFAANIAAIFDGFVAQMGLDEEPSKVLVIPPMLDRGSYPQIDLVRETGWAVVRAMTKGAAVDPDVFERGGYGVGATRLTTALSGQGVVDLGTAIAGAVDRDAQRMEVL